VTIEHATVQVKRKPWGSTDLVPWNDTPANDDPIGELWFQRADAAAPETGLLLKLLFTSEPLSIQVHPDDDFARSIGLANGKTEVWYILSATPDAQVAVGLKRSLSREELRSAISDGSISDLVQWRQVRSGDTIFVPAGTIHAVGAGIVLAEIQQRSDATFRLFDYGRSRELHIDNAVGAARAAPAQRQSPPEKLNETRTALVVSPHFVLEQIDLSAASVWILDAQKETWIVVIEGHGQIASTKVSVGQAVFAEADNVEIEVGPGGLRALLAYPNINAGSSKEWHQARPPRARLKMKEVQTWSH